MPRRATASRKVYRKRRPAGRRPNASGRGFYKGFGKHLGSAIGTGLGSLASAVTGIPGLGAAGSYLGGKAGQLGSQMTGFGSYHIQGANLKRNSLLTPILPNIMNAKYKEGAVIVRNKEYLADVLSATAFTVNTTIPINPGLVGSFPWLSQMADAFEEYEILGMVVYYNTTSGNTTTSQSLGEVVLSTEYNSYAPAPANKQQQLTQIFAVSTVPSQNAIHAIECDPKQNQVSRFYTRSGTPPTGLPLSLTDLGRTTVSVTGCAAAGVTLGELYVDYEIAFYKPKLYTL